MQQAAYGDATRARQSAAQALKLAPTSQGAESEATFAFAMGGDTVRAQTLAGDLGRRFPLDTQVESLWLAGIEAQVALDKRDPAAALNAVEASAPIGLGGIREQYFLPLPCVHPRRSLLGGEPEQRCGRRVSEDSRPQRHRVELLDGSVGAAGHSSRECAAVENLEGRGRRCRPCAGARCLQRFPRPLERRRS
jgi:hypothetical protein